MTCQILLVQLRLQEHKSKLRKAPCVRLTLDFRQKQIELLSLFSYRLWFGLQLSLPDNQLSFQALKLLQRAVLIFLFHLLPLINSQSCAYFSIIPRVHDKFMTFYLLGIKSMEIEFTQCLVSLSVKCSPTKT